MRTALIILVLALSVPAAAAPRPELALGAMVDAADSCPAAQGARKHFLVQARTFADKGLIRRVHKYEDIGKYRTVLDLNASKLEPEIREIHALQMADNESSDRVAHELPMMAAAYRMTGDTLYRDRVVEQLREMTTWKPFQRPGWAVYENGRRPPPDGNDGTWLATGRSIAAIADALEIMPPDSIPPDVRAGLEKRLAEEIPLVIDDWKAKRQWFVRWKNPMTNQWVLPTCGLIRACLVLGPDQNREAYEFGVRNLLEAIDSHGSEGEFEEGISYAQFTVLYMFNTARAMAVSGDSRALDRPFLKRFSTWAVHHQQPASSVINCFDAGAVRIGWSGFLRPVLSLAAVCSGDETARWGLQNIGWCTYNLQMMLAAALPPVGEECAPPLYAYYDRARRVNWRDSWDDKGSGVWVRGGHPLDGHDHLDRGHVNLIIKGKPVLMEAGTPNYGSDNIRACQSCVGHNVLQIGDKPALRKPAPISIEKLDSTGGSIEVDGSQCYEDVDSWQRKVVWDASEMLVRDRVRLKTGRTDNIRFRWHLVTEQPAEIAGRDGRFRVRWDDVVILIRASSPIAVTQSMLPDATMAPGPADSSNDHRHTCVLVESASPAGEIEITTTVRRRSAD